MPTNWTEVIDSSTSTSVAQAAADSAEDAALSASNAAASAASAATSASNAAASASALADASTVTQDMIDDASAAAAASATSASGAASSATAAASSATSASASATSAASSLSGAQAAAVTATAQAALAETSADTAETHRLSAASTLLQVEAVAALATNSTPVLGTCGVMIPYYVYPNNPYSDVTFQALVALVRDYRSVPVLVVLNPSNGPGSVWDGNYAVAIRLLQGAGARVLGYVSTGYAGTIDPTRTEAVVRADIDLWLSLYADDRIDGIFLDEMNYETGPGGIGSDYVNLYARYTAYAHDRNLYPVVGNPGTNQQEAWFSTATSDIIVVHETGTWPVESDMYGNYSGGHANYPTRMRAVLSYAQASLDEHLVRKLRRYVNWIYVTNDVLSPNPWDTVASYMKQLFAALADTGSLGEGPQVLTSGASIAWDAGEVAAATVTLGHNATLGAPTNLLPGRKYRLIATQDGTGSRTLAFNAAFKFASGTTLPLTAAAGKVHVAEFVSDGTSMYCTSVVTYP